MSATVYTARDNAWQTKDWIRYSQTVPLDQNCNAVSSSGMQDAVGAWLTPQDHTQDWSLRLPFYGSSVYLYGTILHAVDPARPMSLVMALEDAPNVSVQVGTSLGSPAHGSTPSACGVMLGSLSTSLGNHVLTVTGSHDGNSFALYNATVFAQQPADSTPPTSNPAAVSSTPPSSPPASSSSSPAIGSDASTAPPSQGSSTTGPGAFATTSSASTPASSGGAQSHGSVDGSSGAAAQQATTLSSGIFADPTPAGAVGASATSKAGRVNVAAIVVPLVLTILLLLALLNFWRWWRARERARSAKPFMYEVQVETLHEPVTVPASGKGVLPATVTETSESEADWSTTHEHDETDISQAVVLLDAVRSAGFTPQALLSSLRRVHDSSDTEHQAPPQYT